MGAEPGLTPPALARRKLLALGAAAGVALSPFIPRAARERIPAEQLWVNPDCGLKTRAWTETTAAIANMVAAARRLRLEVAD